MANVSKHKLASAKADGADATLVQPGDWNDEHVFAGGADGDVLVRATAESDGANWSGAKAPTLPAGTQVKAGAGTETGGLVGVIHVDTAQVGTDANTTEKTLMSFTLPANSLNANGKGVRITYAFKKANNPNSITTRLYFGTTNIASRVTTADNQGTVGDAIVIRTGEAAQLAASKLIVGITIQNAEVTTPVESTTAAITIKLTGQNGTAVANDIVAHLLLVEILN